MAKSKSIRKNMQAWYMSYCSSCGKEIMDQAVICPHCGCATANFNSQPTSQFSSDYPAIRAYAEKAKQIKVLGIIGAVLMFGIGIIFAIIVLCQTAKIKEPAVSTTNPQETAELEKAKRDMLLGQKLSALPMFVFAILIDIVGVAALSSMH